MKNTLGRYFPRCSFCDARSASWVARCPFCHRHPDYSYDDVDTEAADG